MKSKIIHTIIITLISIVSFGQQRCNYYSFHFKSEAYFYRARFDSVADFRWTHFYSVADFQWTHFYSKADFFRAQFDSVADFGRAQFDSVADFGRAHFYSKAHFKWAQFDSVANFGRAQFDSETNFWGAQFDSEADFHGARFDSETNFWDAQFDSEADFVGAQFDSVANFYEAQFDSVANFSWAQFDSKANFRWAVLPQILYFQNVKINGENIDFTEALVDSIPDKRCHIYLTGTDVSKINLRYDMFKLMFEDSIPFDLKSNVYQRLLKQTELLGYKKSYELLDKDYKEATYLRNSENPEYCPFMKWLDKQRNWLDKIWWGYGYNKEYIIGNTLLLFLFFSFINTLLFKHLSLKVYEIPRLMKIRNEIESKNKIILFLKVFPIAAFYTGFIFFSLSFSIDKLKYSKNLKGWRILNLFYFFTVYLVGIVCLGYLANYVLSS
jgi:uncharacterized protein YjbI with pentapeptide repeats